ncbi:MAG: DUF2855 family protein [Gammaproteobacteria bacterium]|nr:DUF2855 family protein [Gammaproteobacteria bacterium]
MAIIAGQTFEVDRTNWNKQRIVESSFDTELADHEVLLKVDRFALTANNISYCVSGDALGYWRFFPAEDNWGRIPAMGYGEAIASACPDVAIGERVFGFFPMSSHLKILAGECSAASFSDISEHRAGLSPFYAQFSRSAANPFYRAENEDLEMLLRGLFTTSWLVEDFMFENKHFGASQYLVTSASSKTSIALALSVRERGTHQAVGLTSNANKDFVEGLGCYQQVIGYDEIASLDPEIGSILVDMAGSAKITAELHRHFADQMLYSCKIGATHINELRASTESLPGARPEFFFAPTQLGKRAKEWGPAVLQKRLAQSLLNFMEFSKGNIQVLQGQGPEAVQSTFQKVLAGTALPSEAFVLSLS